jgi:hypothetical protein
MPGTRPGMATYFQCETPIQSATIKFKHSGGALDVLFEAGIHQLALQQVQR